ncbi:hypothetical protein HRR83_008782 [Exophiala dermatitidis]|nr:hypothetical protein HRR74_007709 [Exophiala dermatitidis]KAJ4533474.1 hypothetical protein HRR77_008634 [Exophiala dermatitidis]KAJ4559115.1 hypothetical protein HRR79_008537 [Exophiala dermatitidis]KAJ4563109.1 hypothetical protein HRR81_008704 [Exophiala dermatitidis]KAJ4588001.1 hypothetical protein HRR83_008782 [Exophiala dermatitidis]
MSPQPHEAIPWLLFPTKACFVHNALYLVHGRLRTLCAGLFVPGHTEELRARALGGLCSFITSVKSRLEKEQKIRTLIMIWKNIRAQKCMKESPSGISQFRVLCHALTAHRYPALHPRQWLDDRGARPTKWRPPQADAGAASCTTLSYAFLKEVR